MSASDTICGPETMIGTTRPESVATGAVRSAASSGAEADLSSLYHDFDNTLNIIAAPADGSLKSLVTFEDTRLAPVHRWYTFKEGYSNNLLPWLQAAGIVPPGMVLRLLDPYMGVATTLLSAQAATSRGQGFAVGVERNPAIRSIAQAKLGWPTYCTAKIQDHITTLNVEPAHGSTVYPVPTLSTFSTVHGNGKTAFDPGALQDLLHYRRWIDRHCGQGPEHHFWVLAWAAIIEEASNTRKDGRALRLITRANVPNVKALLLAQSTRMLQDVCCMQSQDLQPVPAWSIGGDARRLPFGDNTFNVTCYSPPYLNNIDYSEVYKLELWLRGDVTSREEFRTLRLGTLRSHPSVQFPLTAICDSLGPKSWIRRIKKHLLATVPNDRFRDMRHALFAGYIDDMLLTLKEQARVTQPGAPIVCVVGNSLHGSKDHDKILVCTDLIIAAAAQAVGLKIDRLQVARQLPRRDHKNGWLRETIIIMRKPKKRSGAAGVSTD